MAVTAVVPDGGYRSGSRWRLPQWFRMAVTAVVPDGGYRSGSRWRLPQWFPMAVTAVVPDGGYRSGSRFGGGGSVAEAALKEEIRGCGLRPHRHIGLKSHAPRMSRVAPPR